MNVIAFEEHYLVPAIAEANQNSPRKLFDAMRNDQSDSQGGWPEGITDLGEGRIAAMDAAGIDVQILSNVPGAEAVEPSLSVDLARQAKDAVAAAVTGHPDRFRGFATLPTGDPAAAAAELERAVREHGFVGGLSFNLTDKEKIAHLNAERLLRPQQELARRRRQRHRSCSRNLRRRYETD